VWRAGADRVAGRGRGAGEDIVERVGVSKPTVIDRKNRYAAEGIGGLLDRPKPGRPVVVTRSRWCRRSSSRRQSGSAAAHRHQEFLAFLRRVAKACRRRKLHLVVDTYATHKHLAVKARLARSGDLLLDHHPAAIRRGSFASFKDPIAAISRFIDGWTAAAQVEEHRYATIGRSHRVAVGRASTPFSCGPPGATRAAGRAVPSAFGPARRLREARTRVRSDRSGERI
jgi:transposase